MMSSLVNFAVYTYISLTNYLLSADFQLTYKKKLSIVRMCDQLEKY
jgi:hypothetical protein